MITDLDLAAPTSLWPNSTKHSPSSAFKYTQHSSPVRFLTNLGDAAPPFMVKGTGCVIYE